MSDIEITGAVVPAAGAYTLRPARRLLRVYLNEACANYGVSEGDVRGSGVTQRISAARWEYMARARAIGFSFPAIGSFIGKDHTTVMNACRQVAAGHQPQKGRKRREAFPLEAVA